MEDTKAFAPLYGPSSGSSQGGLLASVSIAATATSGATTIFPGTSGMNEFVGIQIANQSTSWAFVNFGVFGNVPAATVAGGYPVGPGAVVVVTVNGEVTGATVILASGTGTVTFTRGAGL